VSVSVSVSVSVCVCLCGLVEWRGLSAVTDDLRLPSSGVAP
jgi:hypothetical protein